MIVARLVWIAFRTEALERLIDPLFLVIVAVQPALFASLAYVLFGPSDPLTYLRFGIVGSGLVGVWNHNLWSSGTVLETERAQGTLETLIAAPAGWEQHVAGRCLFNALLSLLSIIAMYALGAFAFRVTPTEVNPLSLALALVLTAIALATLGLVIGSLFLLTRAANRAAEVLNYPIFIVSGLLFPVAVLPDWAQPMSWIAAPTWSAIAVRNGSEGRIELLPLLALVALIAIHLGTARFLYSVIENRIRVTGSFLLE
jgi:ABC-2 type transport system permease protein